ncbi:MAG: PaaI family thioesterase [Alphaproteobacteria bacterium]|nr:PaaI family thioesterase [Alphaproteobacteria bacterium]
MTLESILEQARRERDLGLISQAIPYAGFLGISAEETDGRVITRLAYNERNLGNPALPALHGGVVGAFLETAAIIELLWARETVSVPKIINITIDYLRPAGPKDSFARGIVTKQGRRIATVAVEAWQDEADRPIATANCHFLLRSG